MRGETIRYSSVLKKNMCQKENKLTNEIAKLETDSIGTRSNKLELKRKELEDIRNKKLSGTMVRARAQWLSEGESLQNFSVHWKNFSTQKKQ